MPRASTVIIVGILVIAFSFSLESSIDPAALAIYKVGVMIIGTLLAMHTGSNNSD